MVPQSEMLVYTMQNVSDLIYKLTHLNLKKKTVEIYGAQKQKRLPGSISG